MNYEIKVFVFLIRHLGLGNLLTITCLFVFNLLILRLIFFKVCQKTISCFTFKIQDRVKDNFFEYIRYILYFQNLY